MGTDALDTSLARERLLKKIRQSQHRTDDLKPAELDAALDYLRARTKGPTPSYDDVVGAFLNQSERLFTTIDRVKTLSEVPAAVQTFLNQHELSTSVAVWPKLSDLPWSQTSLQCKFDAPAGSDMVGVSGTLCAIAETGTLVMASGPNTPASTHLLPETHIAILHTQSIVATMEDAFAVARETLGSMPRALNLVSGPSRTADIEQTIVLGAHGPYRVHVILVDESTGS